MRLVRLLVEAGHEVRGMTRSGEKANGLRAIGAEPVVCDVYDIGALRKAVVGFGAEAVIHELTDLPDDLARMAEFSHGQARIRREGTRNLIDAARAAGASRILAQSVAWHIDGEVGAAVEELERAVLDARGVVLRYGQWYGPGTYFEAQMPPPPRIHIDDAARRTLLALDAPSGFINVTED